VALVVAISLMIWALVGWTTAVETWQTRPVPFDEVHQSAMRIVPTATPTAAPVPTGVPGAVRTPRPTPTPTPFPAAEKDLCLHCHVSGTEHQPGAPLARWSVFGMAGLFFVFGFVRTATLWRTRRPWTPLWVRAVAWADERLQIKAPLEKMLAKPVPRHATHWMYCLGGITFFLFVVQCVTGVLLAFYYKPTPEDAYASIQTIMHDVPFGAVIRGIHSWASQGMILMCVLHMLRVFITGAYKPPRELNWIAGMLLLFITVFFGFTGYLLLWDQRAYWATTVGTDMANYVPIVGEPIMLFLRAGWEVSGATLARFYALHVFVLPAATIFLLLAHFAMVRRQGISGPL